MVPGEGSDAEAVRLPTDHPAVQMGAEMVRQKQSGELKVNAEGAAGDQASGGQASGGQDESEPDAREDWFETDAPSSAEAMSDRLDTSLENVFPDDPGTRDRLGPDLAAQWKSAPGSGAGASSTGYDMEAMAAAAGTLRDHVGEQIALAFHDPVKRFLERWIDEPQWAGIVAGAGLFLIVLVALMILAGYLSGGVRRASLLAPANRMLGVIFGLLRGGVVVALIYIALVNVFDDHADDRQADQPQPKWLETSRLMPHVRRAAAVIEGLVPQDMLPAGIRKRQDSPEETGTL